MTTIPPTPLGTSPTRILLSPRQEANLVSSFLNKIPATVNGVESEEYISVIKNIRDAKRTEPQILDALFSLSTNHKENSTDGFRKIRVLALDTLVKICPENAIRAIKQIIPNNTEDPYLLYVSLRMLCDIGISHKSELSLDEKNDIRKMLLDYLKNSEYSANRRLKRDSFEIALRAIERFGFDDDSTLSSLFELAINRDNYRNEIAHTLYTLTHYKSPNIRPIIQPHITDGDSASAKLLLTVLNMYEAAVRPEIF